MDAPKTLSSIYEQLTAPFPIEDIEIKPGATTKDKAKALALPYADIRVFQDRLDAVAGAENWSVEYRHISENAVFCRLTILGAVREDVGECHKTDKDGVPDDNRTCTAVAQAFKRTCSAFGIGRYIYSLPPLWGEFDAAKRQFVDTQKVVTEIYRRAGLIRGSAPSRPAPEPAPTRSPDPAPVRTSAPAPEPAPMRNREIPPRSTPTKPEPTRAAPQPEPVPAPQPEPSRPRPTPTKPAPDKSSPKF